MKTETCKLYSRAFWIFLPNIIKIYPYYFELYRCKVGPFFLRHSVYKPLGLLLRTSQIISSSFSGSIRTAFVDLGLGPKLCGYWCLF